MGLYNLAAWLEINILLTYLILRVYTNMIGTKKNTFQLELKNRFTALEAHTRDDIDQRQSK